MPRWFRNPWLQLACCIALQTIAEIFFKIGAVQTANPGSAWSWTGISGLCSGYVWCGVVASIVSLFNWLATLRKLPLTIAFPVANIVYVFVPLACWLILGEIISPRRWCGIGLVILGLTIVAQPAAKLEAQL